MMNLNDTISAFRCCTLVPPRCSKCQLTEMCKWSLNRDRCKTEVKLSVYHWLKAQEQVVMAGAELTDAELIDAIRKAPITLKPAVDAIPVEWLREKMRGYASALKSTELSAIVRVMQMWQEEQEAQNG